MSTNFEPKRTAAASRGFLATEWLSCYHSGPVVYDHSQLDTAKCGRLCDICPYTVIWNRQIIVVCTPIMYQMYQNYITLVAFFLVVSHMSTRRTGSKISNNRISGSKGRCPQIFVFAIGWWYLTFSPGAYLPLTILDDVPLSNYSLTNNFRGTKI